MSAASSISWDEVRGWFPALKKWTYLNAASMSPIPTQVHSAMRGFLDRCRDEDVTEEVHLEHAEGLRAKAARFLRCTPEELAFVPSTSAGLVHACAVPEWRPGDNVVAPHASFPAVVLPLRSLEAKGVEVRLVGAPDAAWVPDREIAEAIDERTRLVSVSWVSFVTGHRRNLDLLSQACKQHGALLYGDLIQGAGAIFPDLSRLPLDLAAFQPVKWIPSPSGLGIFYGRGGLLEKSPPGALGWSSVVREGLPGLADYDRPYWPGARRWDVGSVPPLLVHGFEAALDLLELVGREKIERRVQELGGILAKMLEKKGFKVLTPRDPEGRAGITTVEVSKSGPVVASLRDAGVVVADREGRIRISTHFYNNEDDLHRLVEVLPEP